MSKDALFSIGDKVKATIPIKDGEVYHGSIIDIIKEDVDGDECIFYRIELDNGLHISANDFEVTSQ